MTGELNISPLTQVIAASSRPAVLASELLRLTPPQDGLIAPGQSVRADVLSLKQAGQTFQMLLKLTTDNGRQSTVQATGNQPLPQGTQLTVTQPSAGNLAITVLQARSANVAVLTRLDTAQLPAGTLLQGKIISRQVLPAVPGEPLVYRSLVSLLNTVLSGTTLALDSPQPLRIGSLLSALVQDSQNLSFVPLGDHQEQLAVAQQLLTQQARQGSLDSLISHLRNLPQNDELALTPDLRAAIASLLDDLPDMAQLSNPRGLTQALQNSGLFFEAKLLLGQNPTLTPDFKGSLLRLIAQVIPQLPDTATANPGAGAAVLAQALPGFVRSALGALGQVGGKAQPLGFPLPSRLLRTLAGEGSLENLLHLAAAAVSRLQSHQLASLEQTGRTPDGNLQTTWQLEIPLRNLQDIVPLQVKIQREETSENEASEQPQQREHKAPLWRVELAFDLAPLGPLHVQAQLLQGSLSGRLWAERPATAMLIESELGALREQLRASGLNVGELDCHQGLPPQGNQTRLEQRWVDETA
ncbi:flagellar hook-length control protein FliK [Pseudomonas agarici]|uniref:flagellar hook-length control protein FliK n=1 Tax=Pseudomonas agarici TaxID=46677 RepID=UPI000318C095|nr:flagellar hook-length control protein FliK [Pseudomonas agarici]NWC10780.1 flagellar hook-length control protein FliK [Pseudomonas agarici]SEK94481.1 hook-length control protein FliK [Pseudomonas agarici]